MKLTAVNLRRTEDVKITHRILKHEPFLRYVLLFNDISVNMETKLTLCCGKKREKRRIEREYYISIEIIFHYNWKDKLFLIWLDS